MPDNSLRRLAGILIFLMIILTVLQGFLDTGLDLLLVGGLAGWAAAILLIPALPLILKAQALVLLVLGGGFLLYTYLSGGSLQLTRIVASNTPLLTMIAAVGVLRLVAIPDSAAASSLPRGKKSFLQTLCGLSLFSSVINVSAPIIISDRIHAERPLDRLTSRSITRVFCSVSSWSPFYGAMAVVLTYVTDAQLGWIIAAGLPFSLAGLAFVYFGARIRSPDAVDEFVGYPMNRSMLLVPALLTLTVITGFLLFEGKPILLIIAISALLLTLILLGLRKGPDRMAGEIFDFICTGLPRMSNELVLFLSAGVLAVGISGLVDLGLIHNPFTSFTTLTAIQLLGIIICLSAIGVHPVIPITSLTALLTPLDPNPNLLAAVYLFGWHLGTCSSPLSGTNLMFQGRYGIPAFKGAFWNWPYAAGMFLIAMPWLFILARWAPGFQH